jgi:2-phospho-L-lactate guanylyltransferase
MSAEIRWTAIVPVKRTDLAKSRLTHVGPALRQRIALAVAADTVRALQRSRSIIATIVVTDDALAAAAVRELGARVVNDEPDAGLNPALAYGADLAATWFPGTGRVLVSADLPAARPLEIDRALADCARSGNSFVCDVAGTGTTILAARPGLPVTPRFGSRSRAAHRADGCTEVRRPDIVSVRRDVDTWVDLWHAACLGLGPATQTVWAEAKRAAVT